MATIEKMVLDSHRNMKLNKKIDTTTAVNPTYGSALEEREKKGNEVASMLNGMEKNAMKTTVKTPSIGKRIRNAYTEKLHLSESLFESCDTIVESKIEGVEDDVWTFVYDCLFEGNKSTRPLLFENEHIVFPMSRYYYKEPVQTGDIGVIVSKANDEEEKFVRKVAETLGLNVEKVDNLTRMGIGENYSLMIIKFGDTDPLEDAKSFLAKRGINLSDVRPPANSALRKELKAKAKGKELTVAESKAKIFASKNKVLTEDAKVTMPLSEYNPWSGAISTYDKIQDADMMDAFDAYLEEMYPDGIDVTELNDLLWFDGDSVLSYLGIGKDAFEEIDSKTVIEDGFTDDYTWYRRKSDGLNIFILGDKERYEPEDGEAYWDYSTEDDNEAQEWFDSYKLDEGMIDTLGKI